MTLRDDLLPVVDLGGQLAKEFGLSRYAVTIRVRTWTSGTIGDNSVGHVDQDLSLDPHPDVTLMSAFEAQRSGIMMAGGTTEDRFWKLAGITPRHLNDAGQPDGNTPQELVPVLDENQELLYLLTGDDGVAFECTVVLKEFDDPFEYIITLREKRRRTDQNSP